MTEKIPLTEGKIGNSSFRWRTTKRGLQKPNTSLSLCICLRGSLSLRRFFITPRRTSEEC